MTARLNRYAGAARDAEYLQQSDAILNGKAGDAWNLDPWPMADAKASRTDQALRITRQLQSQAK